MDIYERTACKHCKTEIYRHRYPESTNDNRWRHNSGQHSIFCDWSPEALGQPRPKTAAPKKK